MSQGIKLYKHFSEQLNKIGRPRRAWFTTFNLNIHFFEKFILSALVGTPYNELKNAYDFEALNAQLANDEAELTDDKMEVRVFYDYRALEQSNKPKQTSVLLHPIDIKQIKGLKSDKDFNGGVFHPKVVLIETVSGEYWVMVSSANLTFGGWAKNRECFFCEKIESTRVARDIGMFFNGVVGSTKGFGESRLLNKLATGKFGPEGRWNFFSSFDTNSFLDKLNNKNHPQPLKVWSPYFSDDLYEVLEDFQGNEYFDEITIIPAKNDKQQIRITEDLYAACQTLKGVLFRQDKLAAAALESFVHAKVWLTQTSLAIGSWNMTSSGMNRCPDSRNNLEAGVIVQISSKEYESIAETNPSTPLKTPSHLTKEELIEEKEGLLDEFPVAIELVADWDKMVIKLVTPTYAKLIKQLPTDCIFALPGLGNLRITNFENDISFREHSHALLNDRYFEVKRGPDKIIYKGYLREEGLISRPVNSFANIDDYLKGWVSDKPEDKSELFRLAYKVEEEYGDEFSEQTRKILMSDEQNAWFSSFHAYECIIRRINQANSSGYKVDRIAELKRIGRVLPGSLAELRKHLCILKDTYENDRNQFLKSPIYLWFLIEKANVVFRYFNQQINNPDEYIKSLKNINIESVFKIIQTHQLPEQSLRNWMGYIRSKLQIK